MHIKKTLTKTSIVLALIFNLSNNAYAANIDNLIVAGKDVYNQQSDTYKNAVETYMGRVPDYVTELFIRQGGAVQYTDKVLVDNNDVNGIYIFDSKQIKLKVNSVNSEWDEVQKAPVHEIGHYIYHTAGIYFDERQKNDLKNLYYARKSFDFRCYNEDETFAALYSDYIKFNYKGGEHVAPSAEYRIFSEAEEICNQILNNCYK